MRTIVLTKEGEGVAVLLNIEFCNRRVRNILSNILEKFLKIPKG